MLINKFKTISILAASAAALVLCVPTPAASAATIFTQWTFEISQPAATSVTSLGSVIPEVGSGAGIAASVVHANSSNITSPAGNASPHSFSATNWAVGDYYQFTFTGGTGLYLTFDQTSSNTGPRDFNIVTSTDGSNYNATSIYSYTVFANAAPNPTWAATNGSLIYTTSIALPANTVGIRLVDADTVSANGGTVASGGTDRLDNVTISDAPLPTPEPASMALLALGAAALLVRRHK